MMKRWLIALLLLLGATLRANSPVVLAVSYSSSDPILHIGSSMTVYMSAVNASATLSVSVTGATSGQITVGGADLAGLTSGTLVYLTDGTHAWFANTVGGTLSVSNANLVGGASIPATQVADYTALINYSFRAYTGTIISSVGGSSESEYVDLGSFDSLVLNDQGGNGDAFAGDGLWTGTYFVRSLGFAVTGGHLFGNVSVNNVLAGNAPFQSSETFDLDGIRPAIDHFQWSTNDPNYSDMIYLSSLCQGTTTPQPTNGWGRFDVTTNKTGVNVQIVIDTPTPKPLPPIVIPSGAVSPSGFRIWDGTDGTSPDPVFVNDGTYTATLFAYDNYGVPALITLTAQITVISMRMVIDHINVSPAVVVLDPATNQATQNVNTSYRITLKNDSNTSIANALSMLGFGSGPFSDPSNVASTVGSQSSISFLNTGGGLAFGGPIGDVTPGYDTDADVFRWFASDGATFSSPGFGGPIGVSNYPNCYLGLPGGVSSASIAVNVADQTTSNDEDGYEGVFQQQGAPTYFYQPYVASAPTSMAANKAFTTSVTANGPLSLRIQLAEHLATLQANVLSAAPAQPNYPNPCVPSSTSNFFSAAMIHFASTATKLRAVDSSIVIQAQTQQPLVLDSTPPIIVSSDPQASQVLLPNTYGGSGKVLSVNVTDPETGINASTSTLVLLDPTGARVPGTASINGGSGNSATLFFAPGTGLTAGGSYILRVTACNNGGLCLTQDIGFTLKDTASPDVYAVDLTSANQTSPIPLTLNQSVPDGPFDTITQVSVSLSMANSSTNTIDGDNSVVALQSISGTGAPVDIPLTRLSPLKGQTPAGSTSLTLVYSVDTPITGAGKYQVVVTSYAKDGSGNSYSGPANFIPPKFITQANPLALNITYPSGYLAVTGLLPVTMTVGSVATTVTNGVPAARAPGFALLPANTGYAPLTPADADAGLQFVVGGVPLTTAPTFAYPASSNLRATLYYNDSDLPAGVAATNLTLFGYNGMGWRQLSPAEYTGSFANVTRNTFVITLPNGSAADAAYGIFYASSVTSTGSTVATPSVRSSRSFNPNAANPLARVARFYMGKVAPSSLDARVFDTQGRLIRAQSMNAGLSPQVDAGSGLYYFTWDGNNDNANMVRNGVYMVRWQETRVDGSSDTQTKLVVLIK